MKIDFFQISLNFRIIFFSYFYVKIYIKWRKIDIQKNKICFEVVGQCTFDLKQLERHKRRLKKWFSLMD